MFRKRRTNQGGSIVTFVVIGIVLGVALLGALYIVNIRGQQARESQEIASSETNKTKPTTTQTTEPSSNESTAGQMSGEESTNTAETNESAGESESTILPTTGAAVNAGQLVGAYLLTVSFSAYFLSRRKLSRSL